MKYSDIIKNIDDIFDYFKFHSKNLTKTQEYKLDDLRNLIHELRIAMEDKKMIREYRTIRECAELWVNGFDEIDVGMIDKLMMFEPDDWEEVTLPSLSDRVYVYDMPADVETDERYGDIVGIETDEGELSYAIYDIRLDDGTHVSVNSGCFDVEREDEILWAWQFSDAIDTHWIAEQDGIEALSRCGFRVFRSGQFGYFFCIDGGGYDYYKAHWIPLYKASGREWHDVED